MKAASSRSVSSPSPSNPSSSIAELLSQFNTFFILGLADERDRTILRSSAKQDLSALSPEIQTLMPGECLLAGVDAPFAVPARVHLWADALRMRPPPPEAMAQPAANPAAFLDARLDENRRAR